MGHSERRHLFKEEDFLILTRVKAALDEGLKVVLCVGEILQDRKVGQDFQGCGDAAFDFEAGAVGRSFVG